MNHTAKEWAAGSTKLDGSVNEHEKDKQALFSKSLINNEHSVILRTEAGFFDCTFEIL